MLIKIYKNNVYKSIIIFFIFFPSLVGATASFRSLSFVVYSTAANITATEPAGCTQDDIIIASLFIDGVGDVSVTPPSGWSNSFNGTTMMAEINSSGREYRQYGYWIRRGASAPDLTWIHSSTGRQIVLGCYQGALTSGDPFSFGTVGVRDDNTTQNYPDVSGVTTSSNELLVWYGVSYFIAASGDPPTGFTERQDSGTGENSEIADKVQVAAGSTGTITGASVTSGGTNGPQTVLFSGLKDVSAGGGGSSGSTSTVKIRGGVKFRGGAKFR